MHTILYAFFCLSVIMIKRSLKWVLLISTNGVKHDYIRELKIVGIEEELAINKDNKNYIAYSQKTKTYESNYYYTDNGLNAEKSKFTYCVADVLLEYVFYPVFFNLESEDLIHVSILENGNYLLKFNKGNFADNEKESTIVDVEITQEGKMIGASYWFGDSYLPSTDSGKLNSAHYDFEFKYGEVTESEVNAVIDKADAQN